MTKQSEVRVWTILIDKKSNQQAFQNNTKVECLPIKVIAVDDVKELYEALEKQITEWQIEIDENWGDSSHGIYLRENIYEIDKTLTRFREVFE